MTDNESPLPGQMLARVKNFTDSKDMTKDDQRIETFTGIETANIITSRMDHPLEWPGNTHKLVIDLDHPAQLLPSSTPGHHHLLVDLPIPDEVYWELITVMVKAGLVEPGYLGASRARGYTAVRLPWVRKGEETYHCVGCNYTPDELDEYVRLAKDEGYRSPFEAVRRSEGTFNKENGHFICTQCYINMGYPLGVAP